MNKTDSRHYNRRENRLLAIEMDYYCAYIRQETYLGIVSDVKYIGNTVYGQVQLKIGDNWYIMVIDKHRPALKDLNRAVLIRTQESI